VLARAGTHVEPYAPYPVCSLLLLAENPHTPPGHTLGTCAGPPLPLAPPWLHLPPVVGVQLQVMGLAGRLVYYHEVCAHIELSADLQAVLGLPLAPPLLNLPPVVGVHL
jgi:hypothetical protein